MDEIFTCTIHLEELTYRTHQFVKLFNELNSSNSDTSSVLDTNSFSACAIVLDAAAIPNSTQVRGRIRFTVKEFTITLAVIEDSMAAISNFTSRFNMCSAHCCDIRLEVQEDLPEIKVYFTPTDRCKQIIQNFFQLTNS